MAIEEDNSVPFVQSAWIADFLRRTLLDSKLGGDITHWATTLVDALQEHKPEHDVHIFGINRVPRLPNFFLASSTEKFVREKPLLINVTKRTAELFLSPVEPGIRTLQEEMPMTVIYNVEERRLELPFYDAICFDSEGLSIIIGLIVTETTVEQFLTPEELAELHPLVRAHGMPLLETLTLRQVNAKQAEDLDSLLNMMRHSSPELAKISFSKEENEKIPEFVEEARGEKTYDANFLLHIAAEMRSPLMKIVATNEKLIELSNTSLGSPELHELAQNVQYQAKLQEEFIRCLSNMAMLSQADVKPKTGVFPMQAMIRELYPTAVQIASRYEVEIKLEENTRNIFIAGDQKTLLRMIERLLAFSLSCCPGGKLWIRTEDATDRVKKGFMALEFEDSGEVPRELAPGKLLESSNLAHLAHPRLRRGGGLLFMLLAIYMEKSGGEFKIKYGEHDGFCVQLIMPLVSRSEMEKIKAGEVSA